MEGTRLADTVKEEAIGGDNGDKNSDPSSPEFEFWMTRNPSLRQPDLPSADQLFTNGVILPLHLLHQPRSSPEKTSSGVPGSSAKRWNDIFKGTIREKKLETRKKPGGLAEVNLNINIWPFSRSRSTGTESGRWRGGSAAGRRVSSAPCSRSNSRGESCGPAQSARRWASSPARPGAGVRLGRASPVWQPRKSTRKCPQVSSTEGLNVSSRLQECGAENRNSSHFTSLRAFFSKVF